jgi:hypothetical protein
VKNLVSSWFFIFKLSRCESVYCQGFVELLGSLEELFIKGYG